jgi:hypothetical protein
MTARDWRTNLRGAVYRADGQAVVAWLRHTLMPDDVLQLIGDGLVAALTQDVDDAADLAGNCVTALRVRGWDGDNDLADQLEALLTPVATPMLKALPVELDELADILEGDPMQGGGRVDLQAGEVWHQAAIDYAQEIGEEDEDESEDAGHWLWVECAGSREGYRDMELFIGIVDDTDRADRLDVAIRGRGAFGRFKDLLARWPDELERWYAFSEERQRGRARAWLAGAGYCVAPTRRREQ